MSRTVQAGNRTSARRSNDQGLCSVGTHEIDIQEYQRLRQLAEDAEEAWPNRLADEAESEGTAGSVSLEEMAAMLRDQQG
ncbi:hypothetical protein [Streptomyces prasinus]|uniref:hypothetical protein n=1 Tax=Streptomyces prasinus TaxID=67345 RepID=UPI00331C5A36